MGLFNRQPRSALPDYAAEMLADWAQTEFDRAAHPKIAPETDEFIMSLEMRPSERRVQLINEIYELGMRVGGWTACGAWDVLFANFLSPVPDEILDELSRVRVRFFLSLGHPNLHLYLNSVDSITMRDLDPEAYARIHPS